MSTKNETQRQFSAPVGNTGAKRTSVIRRKIKAMAVCYLFRTIQPFLRA